MPPLVLHLQILRILGFTCVFSSDKILVLCLSSYSNSTWLCCIIVSISDTIRFWNFLFILSSLVRNSNDNVNTNILLPKLRPKKDCLKVNDTRLCINNVYILSFQDSNHFLFRRSKVWVVTVWPGRRYPQTCIDTNHITIQFHSLQRS